MFKINQTKSNPPRPKKDLHKPLFYSLVDDLLTVDVSSGRSGFNLHDNKYPAKAFADLDCPKGKKGIIALHLLHWKGTFLSPIEASKRALMLSEMR